MLSRQARSGCQGIALGLIRRLPCPDQAFPFRRMPLILIFGHRSAQFRQPHNALLSDDHKVVVFQLPELIADRGAASTQKLRDVDHPYTVISSGEDQDCLGDFICPLLLQPALRLIPRQAFSSPGASVRLLRLPDQSVIAFSPADGLVHGFPGELFSCLGEVNQVCVIHGEISRFRQHLQRHRHG